MARHRIFHGLLSALMLQETWHKSGYATVLTGSKPLAEAKTQLKTSPVGGAVSGGHGGIEPPPTDQWRGTRRL